MKQKTVTRMYIIVLVWSRNGANKVFVKGHSWCQNEDFVGGATLNLNVTLCIHFYNIIQYHFSSQIKHLNSYLHLCSPLWKLFK